MSDIGLDTEIENLSRLEKALEDGLEEGAKESAEWHVDEGKQKAQDFLRIGHRGNSRIWRREVYEGFRKNVTSKGQGYTAQLQNIAPHATIVENGRRPGATPPQVQDLMAWVIDKLDPVPVDDGEGNLFDNPELQALEDTYGTGYVLTAFNVQDKIRDEGIRGIRFMGKTESYLKQVGPPVTHRKVEKNMQRHVRQHGLR